MAYRLPNSRKSNFATEPVQLLALVFSLDFPHQACYSLTLQYTYQECCCGLRRLLYSVERDQNPWKEGSSWLRKYSVAIFWLPWE